MINRIVAALVLGLASWLANATTVLPLYLDEIVAQSTVAFEGTCVENHGGRDPATGLVVTYTTFTVQDALKGDVGASYTIKQVGGQVPGEATVYRAQGVPKFTVGESYVVFLAGVSSAGFSSPIGLSQGKFTIVPGATGPQVTNGRDFKDMTSRIAPAALPDNTKAKLAQAPGPVPRMGLDDFKQLVRSQLANSTPHEVAK